MIFTITINVMTPHKDIQKQCVNHLSRYLERRQLLHTIMSPTK